MILISIATVYMPDPASATELDTLLLDPDSGGIPRYPRNVADTATLPSPTRPHGGAEEKQPSPLFRPNRSVARLAVPSLRSSSGITWIA